MFREWGDPYDFMATKVYGRVVDRKHVAADKNPGQVGKIVVLGAGYQMGAWKLQGSVRVGFMGMKGILFGQEYVDQLGVNVEAFLYQRSYKKGFATAREEADACKPLNVSTEDHYMHCAVTKFLIDKFRAENDKVVLLWREAQNALELILSGKYGVQVGDKGLVHTCEEGFVLPNGMKIRYYGLRKSSDGKSYKYLANARKKEWTNIYGGKVVENGTQALSRIILSDQMLRISRNLKEGYVLRHNEVAKVVSSTHDEAIVIVPERYASDCLYMMGEEMRTPPGWCKDLPLKSSGGFARSYGACEK